MTVAPPLSAGFITISGLEKRSLMANRCALVTFCLLGACSLLWSRSLLFRAMKTSSGIQGGGTQEEGHLNSWFLNGPGVDCVF